MKKTAVLLFLFVFVAALGGLFIFPKGTFRSDTAPAVKQVGAYDPVEYMPEDLATLLRKEKDKYVVIDARTKLEYDKGHVLTAVHADYFDTEALVKEAGDKIPITYDSYSSMRGPYAAYILYQAGYKNVGILYGGLSAWAEDIQKMESTDAETASVYMHPKNIFPERVKGQYPAGREPVEFNIVARRFAFEPNRIVVQHGQKVTLHIESRDVIHGFALPEYRIEEELLPNVKKDISFVADRKGNFSFITNVVSGRDYASMVGNIIVK